ncbi:MAG: 3-deoxy-D-manno-octulosonic-acid transferase [Acidobacteriota bacterium]|jgi:3-deoxy-D-manno-octulosonic-acid transferase|nr:3-deoxy-D-manno-octulosonic-acid transferase [Acidobacteriota bacterium]
MALLLRGLYQLAAGAFLLIAGPFLLARRGSHYLPTLSGRLGSSTTSVVPRGGPGGFVWIHAVSVGEVAVAATLIKALPPGLPLLVTTVTPTGQERARALFRDRAEIAYLPFDLGFAVRRFFDRFQPRALVLVEGDYWPLVLSEARRRGLPVAVINGRVGDRSYGRMRRMGRLRPLLGYLFSRVDRFGVQSTEDRDRLVSLGVPAERITVTGNLKYESPEPAVKPDLEERLRALAAGRPILLAGSTTPGEEEQVLDAFSRLGGRALLVIAPRHPERWDEVAALLGPNAVRRSAIPEGSKPDIVLLDSLGELAGLYRIAAGAFIGGTLAPKGGHNPLEPARFGVPVAVGPSMHNFRDMAERFDRAHAWRRVKDAEELAAVWGEWIADPGAAREQGGQALLLLEENRGALGRTLEMLEPVLGR